MLGTTASPRKWRDIKPDELKLLDAKIFRPLLAPRINKNPMSPIIDSIVDGLGSKVGISGLRDVVLVDYGRSRFDFDLNKISARAPELANHTIIHASRSIISEIPKHGSGQPKHGWAVRTRLHCRYTWFLNRPSMGNTRINVRLRIVAIPSANLEKAIEQGICQSRFADPPPTLLPTPAVPFRSLEEGFVLPVDSSDAEEIGDSDEEDEAEMLFDLIDNLSLRVLELEQKRSG